MLVYAEQSDDTIANRPDVIFSAQLHVFSFPVSFFPEKKQTTLPHSCHHKLHGPLHLPGSPSGCLRSFHASKVSLDILLYNTKT